MEIAMGQYKVSTEQEDLTATGIGSCLAITLYDRKNRNGGMAHATLPSCVSRESYLVNQKIKIRDAAYVDSAIDVMLTELEKLGASKNDIECKIVGGSNMFPNMEPNIEDIGKRNVESAKKKLKTLKIPLVAESVGGALGRSVGFCPTTGIVTIKIKF